MRIFIINGKPRTGKDTFVELCMLVLNMENRKARSFSSVDVVKQAAKLLGWTGGKTARDRDFLSTLKDLSTAMYDGPMVYMESELNKAEAAGIHAAFFMVREPAEIRRFKERHPESVAVLVTGPPRGEHEATNHADSNVGNYTYDRLIINDGSIDDLRQKALELMASR